MSGGEERAKDTPGEIDLCAILTGGAARRMGGRKADLVVGGQTLVEHTYNRVRCAARRIVCVGGEEYLSHLGVQTIPDLFPGADTMGGIATALKYALDTLGPDAWVLVVGCDMPLISVEVLRVLSKRREGVDIVATHTGPGYEPLYSIYRAGIFPLLKARVEAGQLRVRAIFERAPTAVVGEEELRKIDPDLMSFTNINNPGELENLLGNALLSRNVKC